METTNLWIYQSEYLLGDKQALSKLYSELVLFSKILIKSKSHPAINIDESAHEAATCLIEKYLTNEDFEVTSSWSGVLYHCIQHILYNKKKIKWDRETEVDLTVEFESAPLWDFPQQPVRDIVDDHPMGKHILYKLYKNVTVTRTISEIEALGVSRTWIRDHAVQLFSVKRVLRRGGKICQKKKGSL